MENGRAKSTVVDIRAVEVSVLYSTFFLGTVDDSISRRLAQDLSYPLITTLQQECTRASCPEMKAGEWLYLCVAHGNDGAMEVCFVHNTTSTIDLTSFFYHGKHCCAIDYILHTVDSDCLVKLTTHISF